MSVRLSTEVTIHDAVRVLIECPTGYAGRRWFAITFIGPKGDKTELAVWGPNDEAPELVIEDNVSVRRVQTVSEEEGEGE